MEKKPEIVVLSLDEPLRGSLRQGTSISLPMAIYRRLDMLGDAAVGVDASRAEIIAMLIAEAEIDAESLEQRMISYRKKKVGDVIPRPDRPAKSEPELGENVVSFEKRPPGRPGKREAG